MSADASTLIASLDAIDEGTFQGSEADRIRIKNAARRLVHRLETPYERCRHFVYNYPVTFATLRIFIDIGLWKAWTGAGGGRKSLDELQQFAPGVEKNLLLRLLRQFVADDILRQPERDVFEPTRFSLSLGDEKERTEQWVRACEYQFLSAAENMPAYLAKIGYKDPVDKDYTSYSDSHPEKLSFFGHLVQNPVHMKAFHEHMEGVARVKSPWASIYDSQTLLDGADLEKGPFFVDIGGGTGTDISRVLDKHPDLPAGALILQDLPEVTAKLSIDAKIKPIGYDFFTPQPVKGSRAYYFHAVFHDWPDSGCQDLLANVKGAMIPGYSRLFIQDIVIPEINATLDQTSIDIIMMSLLSASERTKDTWVRLLTEGGFKIIKFWPDDRGLESVIEAEIA